MIVVVDYGVGNLRSVQKAVESLGYSAIISSEARIIKKATTLILPGQGAFSESMNNLQKHGLVPYIKEYIKDQKPFLGICVGFQLLFEKSFEHGVHTGLGIFKGVVKKFDLDLKNYKIPHMGWNALDIKSDPGDYFKTIKNNSFAYFVHSYYVETDQKEIISTTTQYGLEFVSAIQANNLLATQFHPEKSGKIGLEILKSFLIQISERK